MIYSVHNFICTRNKRLALCHNHHPFDVFRLQYSPPPTPTLPRESWHLILIRLCVPEELWRINLLVLRLNRMHVHIWVLGLIFIRWLWTPSSPLLCYAFSSTASRSQLKIKKVLNMTTIWTAKEIQVLPCDVVGGFNETIYDRNNWSFAG